MKIKNLRGSDPFAMLKEVTLQNCKGHPIIYVPNDGNWGDALIHHGTLQFLNSLGLRFQTADRERIRSAIRSGYDFTRTVLVGPGCGAWSKNWPQAREFTSLAAEKFHQVLVFPTTFELGEVEPRKENIVYFRRDEFQSSTNLPNSRFCHDMSLFLEVLVDEPEQFIDVGNFFRTDKERNASSHAPRRNIDLSVAGVHLSSAKIFFDILSCYKLIRTDRLHVAIAASMMGRPVDLYLGNYWKSGAVYESSLKPNYDTVALKDWKDHANLGAWGTVGADAWTKPQGDPHFEDLHSAKWDLPDGGPGRLRYAVLGTPRTGAELVCAYLRQRGLGIPFEYLNPASARTMAPRLDAMTGEAISANTYFQRIVSKRTKNGIFGTKLMPDQILAFNNAEMSNSARFVRNFDRLVLLQRRDKLAQAVSLARAILTNQWAIFGDGEKKRVTADKSVVLAEVANSLSKISSDEAQMEQMIAGIDPGRIRRLTYEDLNEAALESTADWLWTAAGGRPASVTVERAFALPRKLDQGEALAIKRWFLEGGGAR